MANCAQNLAELVRVYSRVVVIRLQLALCFTHKATRMSNEKKWLTTPVKTTLGLKSKKHWRCEANFAIFIRR